MKLIREPLTGAEIKDIEREYGDYVKVTVDIEKGLVVVGPELHADALPMLKDHGSREEDVWGGWVNLVDRMIEMSAVLNIRPSSNNPSMELIDADRRRKLEEAVKSCFEKLWTTE